jgi:paired amphipathic helix protein Sin3a
MNPLPDPNSRAPDSYDPQRPFGNGPGPADRNPAPEQPQSYHPSGSPYNHNTVHQPSVQNRQEDPMMEDIRRQQEQRDREMRERQPNGEPQILHQPVALAPSARVLGPNGLLGNQGQQQAMPPIQASMAQQQVFPAMAGHPAGPPMQQQPQQAPQLLMPFNPTPQPGAPANQPQVSQAQQPILNDALSYLDQVKVQFSDQPDVYNRFLDIMKDFKSGAIDTPGVIERVSYLFAGHPNLIQGFNTFLPPGYRIECGLGDDPNSIRVTTPMGTTHSTLQARPVSPSDGRGSHHQGPNAYHDVPRFLQHMGQPQESFQQEGRPQQAFGPGPGFMSGSPDERRDQAIAAMTQDQRGMAALQHAGPMAEARGLMGRNMAPDSMAPIAGAMGLMNGAAAGPGAERAKGPVEFNHAINYVNKIKNRFASQPDIYKQFLEILQTYQRESKPIGDVYSQVTSLFRSAPDLLEDFKQFLPDTAANNNAAAAARAAQEEDAFPLSSIRGETGYAAAGSQAMLQQTPRGNDQVRLPPVGHFGPTPSSAAGKKRGRNDRQGTMGAGEPINAARASQVPSGPLSKVRCIL